MRRAVTWLGLAVACGLLAVLLVVGIAVLYEVASGKPLSRGESRGGQIIVAVISLGLAGLCVFWIVRAWRSLRASGNGAGRSPGIAARWLGVGRQRARRGKPLSEMSAREIKRAMWLTPAVMGAAVLAGAGRVAIAAIEEQMAVWLAAVLVALIAALPIAVTLRTRRRYRARLSELRDSITGSLPADPPPPLPLRLRAWLIAAPLLFASALVLTAVVPGEGNTCVSKGIATTQARQGICKRGANLFGAGVTYNVVDAGETLQMPGYQASLLNSTVTPTTVSGPYATAALYPNHLGMVVSFQVQIMNDGQRSLQLPVAQVVTVLTPDTPGSQEESQWWPSIGATSAPVPQLGLAAPLTTGQSTSGWISFIVPPAVEETLHARPADLQFYPADGSHDYVGQIRLWKAANRAGSTALGSLRTASQQP